MSRLTKKQLAIDILFKPTEKIEAIETNDINKEHKPNFCRLPTISQDIIDYILSFGDVYVTQKFNSVLRQIQYHRTEFDFFVRKHFYLKKYFYLHILYTNKIKYIKKNVLVCKQIFDINNELKLNIYEGDSLKVDYNKEFKIKKFDIIIGNPPYNA